MRIERLRHAAHLLVLCVLCACPRTENLANSGSSEAGLLGDAGEPDSDLDAELEGGPEEDAMVITYDGGKVFCGNRICQ